MAVYSKCYLIIIHNLRKVVVFFTSPSEAIILNENDCPSDYLGWLEIKCDQNTDLPNNIPNYHAHTIKTNPSGALDY